MTAFWRRIESNAVKGLSGQIIAQQDAVATSLKSISSDSLVPRRQCCSHVLRDDDHARKFRLFAQLLKMKLADTGFTGTWPG